MKIRNFLMILIIMLSIALSAESVKARTNNSSFVQVYEQSDCIADVNVFFSECSFEAYYEIRCVEVEHGISAFCDQDISASQNLKSINYAKNQQNSSAFNGDTGRQNSNGCGYRQLA